MATRIEMEPSTTWLFVSTSPVEVMISPVPAAWLVPLAVWTTVLMSTMAGMTFAAMAEGFVEPVPALGETGVTVWIGASAAALWLVMNRARFQPTPMPPPVATITAAMTAAVRRFAYPGPWVGGATAAGVAVARAGGETARCGRSTRGGLPGSNTWALSTFAGGLCGVCGETQ